MKEKTQLLSDNLTRVNDWTKTADTKAAGIGAITAILIAVLKDIISAFVLLADRVFENGHGFWWLLGAALLLALLIYSLIRTIIFLLLAMKARTKNTKTNMLFFGHISSMSEKKYLKIMRDKTAEQIEEDLINQTHTNSVIASTKYRLVNHAVISVFAAAVLMLSVLVIISLGTLYSQPLTVG